MNLEELQQFLKISESSIETAKLAEQAISKLHIKYCELFRNEIDNLWHDSDGRRKMCGEFVDAAQHFCTLIQLHRHKEKAKKQ